MAKKKCTAFCEKCSINFLQYYSTIEAKKVRDRGKIREMLELGLVIGGKVG